MLLSDVKAGSKEVSHAKTITEGAAFTYIRLGVWFFSQSMTTHKH